MKKGFVKNKTNDGVTSVRNKDGSINKRLLKQALINAENDCKLREYLRKSKLNIFEDGVPLSWETALFKLSEYGIKVVLK